jgi:O-antigen/teichoic acid export membrane protein
LGLGLGILEPGRLLTLDPAAFSARSFVIDGIERAVGISFFTILLMGLVATLQASGVLQLLLLTLPFFAYASAQENLLLAVPRPRALLACRVAASSLHMLVAALLIPPYGAAGAAVGCLLGQVVFCVITAVAWRREGAALPLQRAMLAAIAATLFAAGVLALTQPWVLWLRLCLAAASYLTALIALRGIRLGELAMLLSYMRSAIGHGGKAA